MNSENWQKVEELLNAVLEIELHERPNFLSGISTEDLRREVESLLVGEAEAEKFLASPVVAFSAEFFDDEDAPDALINQTIGNYKIVGELGRGGMGAVYLGERIDGKFSQQVAVKLLKRELNTADIRRRFAHERQILAALAHPNIARLLDAGTTADGLPYLVMEYVEGVPIDEFCDARNLDLNERLELFRAVCEAVAFAHRNLIVHRDLKPTNILVNQDGISKLLDFGISKLLTPEYEADSENTVTKLGAMTPEYASPEQLRGESVTTATDVYSLGVILYELLTARRPFELKKQSVEEVMRAVCETEPSPPSAALNAERGMWNAELKEFGQNHGKGNTKQSKQKTVPHSAFRIPRSGDLDNIVLKALKKEPNRRYSSVEQFAEDIRRHLTNLPVVARPDTLHYRATKFINRNRIAVLASLLIFLTLIGGIVATVWQARRAEANRIRAEKRFNDVRRLSNALLFELSPKIERLQGATEARDVLVSRALEYLDSLAQEAEGDLVLQSELATAYEKIGDLQGNPSNPSLVDFDAAIKSYEKSRLIRLKLLEKDPSDFEQQKLLAENYRALGRIYGEVVDRKSEAGNLETALQIYEKQIAAAPESDELTFAIAQINHDLGRSRQNSKRYADAFPFFEKAIASLENLRQKTPDKPDILKLLGNCHIQYALALSWEGRQKEAKAETTQAIETLEKAIFGNSGDTNLISGLWGGYFLASSVYEEQNDALAHEYALKALNLAEGFVQKDAANIRAKQQLAKSYSIAGQTGANIGKVAEAVQFLEKGYQIMREITESRSKNRSLKKDFTSILMRLGEAKFKQGKYREALADFEQAVKIHQEILRDFPGDPTTSRNLAITYGSVAETHRKISGEKSPAAREHYQKQLEILLEHEAKNILAEYDKKVLDGVKTILQKF